MFVLYLSAVKCIPIVTAAPSSAVWECLCLLRLFYDSITSDWELPLAWLGRTVSCGFRVLSLNIWCLESRLMSDRVVLSALRLSWGGAVMLLSPYGVYRIIVPVFFFPREGGCPAFIKRRASMYASLWMDSLCCFVSISVSCCLLPCALPIPPPPPPIWGPKRAAHCSLHGNYITPVC